MVIGKWKCDISGSPKWEPIKICHINSFLKCCKIICTYSITQLVYAKVELIIISSNHWA